jgi:hypothetical protein
MNMCESYLPRTYLKIYRASSYRCIGIINVPMPEPRELFLVVRDYYSYLVKPGAGGMQHIQIFEMIALYFSMQEEDILK